MFQLAHSCSFRENKVVCVKGIHWEPISQSHDPFPVCQIHWLSGIHFLAKYCVSFWQDSCLWAQKESLAGWDLGGQHETVHFTEGERSWMEPWGSDLHLECDSVGGRCTQASTPWKNLSPYGICCRVCFIFRVSETLGVFQFSRQIKNESVTTDQRSFNLEDIFKICIIKIFTDF